jgi:hypothetical protein
MQAQIQNGRISLFLLLDLKSALLFETLMRSREPDTGANVSGPSHNELQNILPIYKPQQNSVSKLNSNN